MTLITKQDGTVDYKATYEHCHAQHKGYQDHNNGVDYEEYWLNDLPDQVLEIGCGNGQLCEKLQQMGYSVTGVDVAEGDYQRSYPFIKYDITNTPWPWGDRQFGSGLAFDVLEHIEPNKVADVVRELVRVSDRQVLSIPDARSVGHLHLIIQPCERWLEWLRMVTDGKWKLVKTVNRWNVMRKMEVHTGIFIRHE